MLHRWGLIALLLAAPLDAQQSGGAAVAVAASDLDHLARELARGAASDEEKAWNAYRWIAENIAYDVEGYRTGRISGGSPEEVLRSGEAVCGGFASLFEELGRRMGLEVVRIDGYAKGYDFRPGDRFQKENHAWNAVRIGREWKLVDATWAAGYVEGERFVRSFSDAWFLTPPERMLFTHLPLERRWQLVRKPLSQRQFEKQVQLTPGFLSFGFSPESIRERAGEKRFRGFVEAFPYTGRTLVAERAPLEKHLRSGTTADFHLQAPDAATVAVVNAGAWHYLQPGGEHFTGTIPLVQGPAVVVAKFRGQAEYSTILVYTVE